MNEVAQWRNTVTGTLVSATAEQIAFLPGVWELVTTLAPQAEPSVEKAQSGKAER